MKAAHQAGVNLFQDAAKARLKRPSPGATGDNDDNATFTNKRRLRPVQTAPPKNSDMAR